MSSQILSQYGTPTAFTITVASLASSTAGVGRQSTIVANASPGKPRAMIGVKVKMGTSPSNNTPVYIYAIRDDGVTNIRTDGAGASDAGLTVINAQLIGSLNTGASASTGQVLQDIFIFDEPGPAFGVAIVQGTGAAFDGTGTNHVVEYILVNPQAQ